MRDTPCGSASSVAKKILHHSYEDLKAFKEKIYHEHQNEENENYCLAEMDPLHPLMQEAADIIKESIFEACGFPTLRDAVLEVVRETGRIDMAKLKETIIDQREECEAINTLKRCIEELAEEGKITVTDGDNPVLSLA